RGSASGPAPADPHPGTGPVPVRAPLVRSRCRCARNESDVVLERLPMSQFLGWIATLPTWLQIVLVIAAFLAVIAALLFFIEIAPRGGRKYTVIRLAVCVLVPLLAMLLLGSVFWAA